MSNTKKYIFNGTLEQEIKLKKIIFQYKNIAGCIMPILQNAQNIYGYLPEEVQKIISKELKMPISKIYGIVTFYSQFSLVPKGKYKISICLGTACYVQGSNDILKAFEKKLSIKSGECTSDGLFSIDSSRCIGACGLAPVITINDDVYGKVKISDVDNIISKYIV